MVWFSLVTKQGYSETDELLNSQILHGTGIFTYLLAAKFMVNVVTLR